MVAGTWARSPWASYATSRPAPRKSANRAGQVVEAGVVGTVRARRPRRAVHGAADVGHGPAADPLGIAQRGPGVLEVVAVSLFGGLVDLAAGRREVQHRHAQGVGDEVVHLAADPVALLEHGLALPVACSRAWASMRSCWERITNPMSRPTAMPAAQIATSGPARLPAEPDRDDDRLPGGHHRDPAPESAHRRDVTGREDEQERRPFVLHRVDRHEEQHRRRR